MDVDSYDSVRRQARVLDASPDCSSRVIWKLAVRLPSYVSGKSEVLASPLFSCAAWTILYAC